MPVLPPRIAQTAPRIIGEPSLNGTLPGTAWPLVDVPVDEAEINIIPSDPSVERLVISRILATELAANNCVAVVLLITVSAVVIRAPPG